MSTKKDISGCPSNDTELKNLHNNGYALNEPVLNGLAPYRGQHTNRFGQYSADLEKEVTPSKYKIRFDY